MATLDEQVELMELMGIPVISKPKRHRGACHTIITNGEGGKGLYAIIQPYQDDIEEEEGELLCTSNRPVN